MNEVAQFLNGKLVRIDDHDLRSGPYNTINYVGNSMLINDMRDDGKSMALHILAIEKESQTSSIGYNCSLTRRGYSLLFWKGSIKAWQHDTTCFVLFDANVSFKCFRVVR